MRIAMWSGPRNLSTAMMYAFDARDDMSVVDEPFYAAYLDATGLGHPMRDEIIASQATDADQVARGLLDTIPAEQPHFYQKHMCQHMLPSVPRNWMAEVVNIFLIRHPARVIASFGAKYEAMTLADIGFAQQTELFEHVRALGQTPIVLDSADIRRDPAGMLHALCDAIGLIWDPAMLSWPSGGSPADGVWAPVWYGAVHRSTGFAGPEGDLPEISGEQTALLEAALPHYERLAALRLRG